MQAHWLLSWSSRMCFCECTFMQAAAWSVACLTAQDSGQEEGNTSTTHPSITSPPLTQSPSRSHLSVCSKPGLEVWWLTDKTTAPQRLSTDHTTQCQERSVRALPILLVHFKDCLKCSHILTPGIYHKKIIRFKKIITAWAAHFSILVTAYRTHSRPKRIKTT